MRLALVAAIWLTVALVAHLLVWRLSPPRRQTRALGVIFLAIGCAGWFVNEVCPLPTWLLLTGWELLQVELLLLAVSLAYIEAYTAIEEDSPSMTILLDVWRSGGLGRSEAELLGLISDEAVVGRRLRAMLGAGVVSQADGKYRLTPSGLAWARLFRWVRGLYRLPLGG